tara:strand:+ start:54 stop:308 length:255 start_codon:yes stop_codon:yes gene_type:complete
MYDPSTKYEQAETTSDEIQFDLNCEADNRDRVDPNALFQGIDHIVRMMQKQGFDKISEESKKAYVELIVLQNEVSKGLTLTYYP